MQQQDTTNAPPFLTAKQAAAQLTLGLTTIYELYHKGEIRGFRVAHKGIRVSRESIKDYIKRQSNAAPVPAAAPAATAGPEETHEPAVLPMPKVKRRAARANRKSKTFEEMVLIRSA